MELELKDGVAVIALILSSYNTWVAYRSKRRRIRLKVNADFYREVGEDNIAWVPVGFDFTCVVMNEGEVSVTIESAKVVIESQKPVRASMFPGKCPFELRPGTQCKFVVRIESREMAPGTKLEYQVVDGLDKVYKSPPWKYDPPANILVS